MIDRRVILLAWAATVFFANNAIAQSPPAAVIGLDGQHPAAYYKSANTLFNAGKRDDAVFVFYLGQLRFRTHLAARPDLPVDQDRAVFSSLSEVIGRPLNEYAFGDLPQLDRTLRAVFAYDKTNPDRFTPPDQFPDATRLQRDGMEKMRQHILSNANDMRKQRKSNGLENRN